MAFDLEFNFDVIALSAAARALFGECVEGKADISIVDNGYLIEDIWPAGVDDVIAEDDPHHAEIEAAIRAKHDGNIWDEIYILNAEVRSGEGRWEERYERV